jgi:uncharacterized protein YigA (DUF484 family)
LADIETKKNIVDFSSHLIEKLQKQVSQEKKQKQTIIQSFRNYKRLQSNINKSTVALISCENLEQFFGVIYQDLPHFFQCDIVRLGFESELIGYSESFYPEYSYSGLKFLPIDFCKNLFFVQSYFIDNNKSYSNLALYNDCIDLAKSSLHLKLNLIDDSKDALISFGSRTENYFTNAAYDTELLNNFAKIMSIILNNLLKNNDGLI